MHEQRWTSTGRFFSTVAVAALAACGGNDPASPTDTGTGGSGAGVSNGGAGGGVTSSLAITDVTITQGVAKPLVAMSQASTGGVPLVAGRAALVRIHAAAAERAGGAVEARFVIDDEVVAADGILDAAPTEGDLDTTLNVPVPSELFTAGDHSFYVELVVEGETIARYPATGEASVNVAHPGAAIELVFLPIDYSPGGSLATLSEATMKAVADGVFARYPVREVTTSVASPMTYDAAIEPGSLDDWMAFVAAVQQRRADDAAAPRQFYLGMLHPGVTAPEWCASDCLLGASPDVSPTYDPSSHVVVGLAYDTFPDVLLTTVLSGMGEALDRPRVACDYTDGWGFDLLTGALFPPETTADFMTSGACNSTGSWASTDSYEHFAERLALVDGGR